MRILLGGLSVTDREVVHQAWPGDAVLVWAATIDEVRESMLLCAPDLLLLESKTIDLDTILRKLARLAPVPVIVILSEESLLPSPVTSLPCIFGCIARPISARLIREQALIAHARFQEVDILQRDIEELRQAFAGRKLIERAKGMLMEVGRIGENEAYIRMREESRRRRISLIEVAKAVLYDEISLTQSQALSKSLPEEATAGSYRLV